jgi:hypothetical protein
MFILVFNHVHKKLLNHKDVVQLSRVWRYQIVKACQACMDPGSIPAMVP